MGAFKERLAALGELAGPRKYVFFTFIATILIFADQIEKWVRWGFARWLQIEIPPEIPGMIFGVPSWIVGITFGVLVLWWWTLEYVIRLKRRLNPGIDITFEGRAPWVNQVTANMGIEAIYIRFKVENKTPGTVVRGCEAFLTRISRRDEAGNFIQVSSGDSLRLPWAARPKDKVHTEMSIPYGVNLFCDLLNVDEVNNQLIVHWDMHLNVNRGITSSHGVYQFDVLAISSNGGPVTAQIYVEWLGRWNTIRAWKG